MSPDITIEAGAAALEPGPIVLIDPTQEKLDCIIRLLEKIADLLETIKDR